MAPGSIRAMVRSHGEPQMLREVAHSTMARSQVGVPLPEQLGDEAAHRVAGRDDPCDAQRDGDGGHVVGALFQAVPGAARALAVVAQVEGDHSVALGQRSHHARPVQLRGQRRAVQTAGALGAPASQTTNRPRPGMSTIRRCATRGRAVRSMRLIGSPPVARTAPGRRLLREYYSGVVFAKLLTHIATADVHSQTTTLRRTGTDPGPRTAPASGPGSARRPRRPPAGGGASWSRARGDVAGRGPPRRSPRAGRRTAPGVVCLQPEPAGPVEVALGRHHGRPRPRVPAQPQQAVVERLVEREELLEVDVRAPAAGQVRAQLGAPRRGRAPRAGRRVRRARRPRAGTARRRRGPGRPARRTTPPAGRPAPGPPRPGGSGSRAPVCG